ncbi:hypothetical protein AJ80_00055 [Polytolypa hystricis UAMH7299]|uniref:Transcription initiation factor IIA large subunit n=1 Tax=Polytolypa hystricis (strain UAMH7299) TaxID=1447883 RepID=A0A2B7Z3I8_POLH7|nr:hypothetical protein AJ80_00055 [Polytolypa hystricis UAMH7299]
MSNQQVGAIYERVVQEVCDSSQIDFEEGGVDQQTLEDLRKGWQKKLSSLGVAHFPWDPAPQLPPPPPQQTPIPPPPVTVPSNAPSTTPPPQQHETIPQQMHHGQQMHQQPMPIQAPGPNPETGDVGIKAEAGSAPPSSSGHPAMTTMAPMAAANLAQQRAANALQQRYGAAAANQIHQLQAQSQAALSLPGQQQQQQQQQQRFQQAPNTQLQDAKPVPHYPNAGQPPQQNSSLGNAQNDGASDPLLEWKAEVARRREAAQKQDGAGDRALREYVMSRALDLEGGGLMTPLDEQRGLSKGKKRKVAFSVQPTLSAEPTASDAATASMASAPASAPAQFDGADEEYDEDAINSDLDDPEDMFDEDGDGDESIGQMMLCTYDKVQRVKSKWKCTLKDGILTTGGREYVFHKGQGEFEWS